MIDTANLPENPGCYLYSDEAGTIIYVGKAKNIKKRVSSYFSKKDHDPKTKSLVAHIASVDVVVTDTETEAFLLENTLIKKHQPKYNIDLKDAKRYAWIELTREEFPRLVIARKTTGRRDVLRAVCFGRGARLRAQGGKKSFPPPDLQKTPEASLPPAPHAVLQRPLHRHREPGRVRREREKSRPAPQGEIPGTAR